MFLVTKNWKCLSSAQRVNYTYLLVFKFGIEKNKMEIVEYGFCVKYSFVFPGYF